jgi:hypothetical protein
VGAGVTADEFENGMDYRLKQRRGKAGRERNSEAVAVAGCIFGSYEAAFTGDAQLEQAAGTNQAIDMLQKIRRDYAAGEFLAGEIAEAQAEIVNAIGGTGAMGFGEALRGFFYVRDCIGVEQLAQIGLTKQFAQLILIDGESLGAALGERGVAIVEKIGYVAEQQRCGEGRRLSRLHHVNAELALLDGAQGFNQRRHVKDVAQTLAIGLKQQGERGITGSDAEQIVGALAQLP